MKLLSVLLALALVDCSPCTRPVTVNYSRCCDGTPATCTGRGCCSHHGGVCTFQRIEEQPIMCPIDASQDQ